MFLMYELLLDKFGECVAILRINFPIYYISFVILFLYNVSRLSL